MVNETCLDASNIRLIVKNIASFLNGEGGEIQVQLTSKIEDEWDGDLYHKLAQELQCLTEILFVSATELDASATESQVGKTLIIYQRSVPNKTKLIVPSLPINELATFEPPPFRQGARGSVMKYSSWIKRFMDIPLDSMTKDVSGDVSVFEENPIRTCSWMQLDKTGSRDYKFIKKSLLQGVNVKEALPQLFEEYFTSGYLNVFRKFQLIFGVEDKSLFPVGIPLDWTGLRGDSKNEYVAFAFKQSLLHAPVYPVVRPDWIAVRLTPLLDTSPQNWSPDVHLVTVYSHSLDDTYEFLKRASKYSINVAFRPCGSVERTCKKKNWTEPVFQIVLPKDQQRMLDQDQLGDDRKFNWDDWKINDLEKFEPRYLVSLAVETPESIPQAFLDQKPGSKFQFEWPIRSDSFAAIPIDAVWLRLTCQKMFGGSVTAKFKSDLYVPVLVRSTKSGANANVETYLTSALGFIPQFKGEFLDFQWTTEIAPLLLGSRTPLLVIVWDEAGQKAWHDLQQKLYLPRSRQIIILVPYDPPRLQNQLGLLHDLMKEFGHSLLDVRLLPSREHEARFSNSPLPFIKVVPSLASPSNIASTPQSPVASSMHVIDSLPNYDDILCRPTDEIMRPIVQNYIRGLEPGKPPSWWLFPNRIVITSFARYIDSVIRESWPAQSQSITKLTLVKQMACCGATTLARTVCYLQHKHTEIIWLLNLSESNLVEAVKLVEARIVSSTFTNIIIATDQNIKTIKTETLFGMLRLPQRKKILWLSIETPSRKNDPLVPNAGIFEVDGLVDIEDAPTFVEMLSILGNQQALKVIADRAKSGKASTWDRKLIVFVLAATKGMHSPIREWIIEQISLIQNDDPKVASAAMAITLFSHFCPNHSGALYYDKWKSYFELDAYSPLPAKAFWNLFSLLVKHNNSQIPFVDSVHPYISDLCLKQFLSILYSTPKKYVPFEPLRKCWKESIEFVIQYPSSNSNAVKSFLQQKIDPDAEFSPFVGELIYSRISMEQINCTNLTTPATWPIQTWKNVANSVTRTLSIIVDKIPDLAAHCQILISRVYRYFSRQLPNDRLADKHVLLEEAKRWAKKAVESAGDLHSESRYEIHMASHNLAVVYGSFAKAPLDVEDGIRTAAKCHKLLKALYENDTYNRQEKPALVECALRYLQGTSHQQYWDSLPKKSGTELRTVIKPFEVQPPLFRCDNLHVSMDEAIGRCKDMDDA